MPGTDRSGSAVWRAAALGAVALVGVALFAYGAAGLLGIAEGPLLGGTAVGMVAEEDSPATATPTAAPPTTEGNPPSDGETSTEQGQRTTASEPPDRRDGRSGALSVVEASRPDGAAAVRATLELAWNASPAGPTRVVVSARTADGDWRRVYASVTDTDEGRLRLRVRNVTLFAAAGGDETSGLVVLAVTVRTPNGTRLVRLASQRVVVGAESSDRG